MKGSILVLLGVALGCAAGAVGLGPTRRVAAAQPVAQYCTDTGDFNNTGALDALVRRAGQEGWALIGVYRPSGGLGATFHDYVCFRQQ